MQFFYDGQIRRYLLQVIRLMSNFVVKHGDGKLERVPVMYGDMDRQVANAINQNSENALVSAPKIAVYISNLEMDRNRLSDSSYVGKLHIRERDVREDGSYGYVQGQGYTVERLMPTPYNLTFKADIWTTSTEQKLQILEQILMLFNPSLEIQTTDNYIDWTSLSVVDLTDVVFSSRAIPVGTTTPIDIATLTLQTPIWISPPAKVKKLGVITSVITSIFGQISDPDPDYVEGLGTDLNSGTIAPIDHWFDHAYTIGNYDIEVSGKNIRLLSSTSSSTVSWTSVVEQYPGKYTPGLAKICLKQADGSEVVGYGSINEMNDVQFSISEWDIDTYPTNDSIPGPARYENAWGSFDAIIDPTQKGPTNLQPGTRYLIVEGIGGGVRDIFTSATTAQLINTNVEFDNMDDFKLFVNNVEVNAIPINRDGILFLQASSPIPANSVISYEIYVNADGPDAWKNADGSDFIADPNDIIEWDGERWHVVFFAKKSKDVLLYQTNIFTLAQYKWNGIAWVLSFEGEYRRGQWRLVL